MVKGFVSLFLFIALFCADSSFAQDASRKKILLGFVQVSSEGAWRAANTKSIQDSAAKSGIELIFKEGKNNFTNQTEEMRLLINNGVDVLAFSPSQETGWDVVLAEAKAAQIPVVVVDRAISTADESLYVTHIGSDMVEEGRRAGRWLLNYLAKADKKESVNIFVLEGVKGSTPAVHRDKGFREILASNPNCKIVRSESADFIFSKGVESTEKALIDLDGKIDVIFAHNDDMALGAIKALKDHGKVPGKDVIVIGVDATKSALEAIAKGEMNVTIECSPLLGPQLMKVVRDVASGKSVDRNIITQEVDFDASNAKEALPSRVY